MAKNHSQLYYLKMVRSTLERIHALNPADKKAFDILKKKAQKYLAKAREFETGPVPPPVGDKLM